jgi:hypothetical protein
MVVLLLFHLNLSAFFLFNSSEKSFSIISGSDGEVAVLGCNTLRCYIIEGAGYYLDSHADFLRFLQRLEVGELNGLDYDQLRLDVDSVIFKLFNAREKYLHLKQTADMTPYNPNVIAQLLTFDYDVFRENKRLIGPVFDKVRVFLGNGAVREMYGEIVKKIDKISAVAYVVKEKIDAGEFPELSSLYDLNELYAETLLFGKYAAMVYQEIK